MAQSIGSVIHEVIHKLTQQIQATEAHARLIGEKGKPARSQYQEGVKDGLNRAIRALEQVDTTE